LGQTNRGTWVTASSAGGAPFNPTAGAVQAQPAAAAGDGSGGGGGSGAGDTGDPHQPHKLRPNSLSGPLGWASLRRSSATSVGGHLPSLSEQQQQQQGMVQQQGVALQPGQQQEEGVLGQHGDWSEPAAAAAAAAGGVDPTQLMLTAGGLQKDLQEVCALNCNCVLQKLQVCAAVLSATATSDIQHMTACLGLPVCSTAATHPTMYHTYCCMQAERLACQASLLYRTARQPYCV
jgi:hypothetical protein